MKTLRTHLNTTLRLLGSALLCLAWVNLGAISIHEFTPIRATLWVLGVVAAFLGFHAWRGRGFARLRRWARARLRRPRAGAGRVVGVAAILLVAEIGLGLFMLRLGFKESSSTILSDYLKRPGGWVPVLLVIGLLAPVVEEIGFRGWVQRRMERRWGPVAALAATSALFTWAHAETVGVPTRFVFGLAAGYIALRTGSVWLSVLFHSTSNLIAGCLIILAPGMESETMLAWVARTGGLAAHLLATAASLAVSAWLLRRLPARREAWPATTTSAPRARDFRPWPSTTRSPRT